MGFVADRFSRAYGTRCDASQIPEVAKVAVDDVTALAAQFPVRHSLFPIGLAGDDRLESMFLEEGAKSIGVISFVEHKHS